jgi:hypothetical protein
MVGEGPPSTAQRTNSIIKKKKKNNKNPGDKKSHTQAP